MQVGIIGEEYAMHTVADQLHQKKNHAQSWPITCMFVVQYLLSQLNERFSTVQMLMRRRYNIACPYNAYHPPQNTI